MARSRRPILLVLLLLVLAGGLLATAQAGSTCADGKKTDEQLLQIASRDLVHELRAAAASVLAERLSKRVEEGQIPDLNYLEALAASPSLELREIVSGPLIFAYEEALSRGELSLDELIQGIGTGETFELRLARAGTALLALFSREALGLSLAEFSRLEELPAELSLAPELALDLLRRLERLMGGGEEKLWGYRFDGSSEAIRWAAAILGFIFPIFTRTEPVAFQLHPCQGWLEVAGEGETPELRSFASYVYFFFADGYCRPREPETLRELAVSGASSEVRYYAAFLYLDLVGEELGLAELIDLTIHGESEELRDIAKIFLSLRFFDALFEEEMSPEELYTLALEGETPQLRWAAGDALGSYWSFRLDPIGSVRWGRLEISDIPRRSQAEASSLEQALIIFAVENTVAYPELAQAAIEPLVFIWSGLP